MLLLLIARRPDGGLPISDESIFWIFNMCKYDWFPLADPSPTRRFNEVRDARALQRSRAKESEKARTTSPHVQTRA